MLWFDRLELNQILVKDSENNTMFSIDRMRINFNLFQLTKGKEVNIDGIHIEKADVFLKMIPESDSSEELNINIYIDRINKAFGSSATGGASPIINIGEALIEHSIFRYDDGSNDSLSGFDYHRFALDIDDANLNTFMIQGDTIQFNVASLQVQDHKTKLATQEFSSFFRISQKSMEFTNLKAKLGNSELSDTLIFLFDSQRDLNDFNNRVTIQAHFDQAILDPQDLNLFIEGAKIIDTPLLLSGNLRGRINNFELKNMLLTKGRSKLQGKVSMEGLPNIEETFIQADLNNSSVQFTDLAFALNATVIEKLSPLGSTKLSGQFLGYINDFVADGSFNTELGLLQSDINLKINQAQPERSTYSGNLSTKNFQLGNYLKDTTTFQNLSLQGTIRGAGLTVSTADFLLNGTIEAIGIAKYNFQNIVTNARFAREFFAGKISINDPNVKANLQGSIDLRNAINKVKLDGVFDTIQVNNLGFNKEELNMSAAVHIDSKGFELDSLVGEASLSNFYVQYKGTPLQVDNISLKANRQDNNHELKLSSDLVDASVKGTFYFSDLFNDFATLLTELKLKINNDSIQTAEFYKNLTPLRKSYTANLHILLKDFKPLASLLRLDLSVTPNLVVDGTFTQDLNTIFNAFTNIPTVRYKNFTFQNTAIEINTSKLNSSADILAVLFIQSEAQMLGAINTKNLLTEIVWNKSHIDFAVDLDQQTIDNNIRMRGTVDFKDSTYLHLANSSFKLLDKTWNVIPKTHISKKGNEWHFEQVGFTEGMQQFRLQGNFSKDENQALSVSFKNIELANINSLITEKLAGKLNAEFLVKNIYGNTSIENTLDLRALTINNFLVGNSIGKNTWDKVLKRFKLDFLVNREGIESVKLNGYYDPANETNPLNVIANLNEANLKLLEPITRGIFSEMDGSITGKFTIAGTLNSPQITGNAKINDGQLMVDYLKTLYKFTGTMGMTPTSVYFDNMQLTDAYNNKGKLDGFITHQNFSDMRISLDASFARFMVLNTTAKDNDLFYGQGFATGTLNFAGPVANLKISANAKTERNSRLFIPLTNSGTIEKKEFISFVNFNDSTRKVKSNEANKKKLTGITLDLNLEITEEAYCEIIFDIKAGDIIRGRGNGDLRIQLDTKGEFNMFGGVTFTQGGYNFTLYNLINKEFEIKKGSSITWAGDPYQGQLKISAAYNQMASIAPIILDPANQDDPALRRKYPLQVLLNLDGPMLSPLINFDIVAKDLPQTITLNSGDTKRLAFEFEAFKTKLDEQELKKQVFSLIILRRLSPLNELISTSGSVTNSVSELLSNQLSYWMSQVDENLEVNVDLGALDAEAFNTFQLRLSYTFLNGRLRITRDGTFTNQNAANATNTNANTSALVGDWTVDYLLTADGKFKMRMYNRTNANNVLNALNNQNNITTGISLQHTQNFNTLNDLWKSARKRKEENPSTPENNSDAVRKEDEGSHDE